MLFNLILDGLAEAADVAVVVDLDVVEAGTRGQARHCRNSAQQWIDKSSSNLFADRVLRRKMQIYQNLCRELTDKRTSRIGIRKPVGAPIKLASCENDK
jgi:hypothetical protein